MFVFLELCLEMSAEYVPLILGAWCSHSVLTAPYCGV